MKVANHNLARSLIIDLCDASKLSDVKPMNFLLSCGEQINKKKSIFGTFPLIYIILIYATQKTGNGAETGHFYICSCRKT